MSPAEVIRRFQTLSQHIDEDVVLSLEETKADFIRLNEDQWKEGIRRDGLPITPEPYSAAYGKLRRKKGLQTDFIDLYSTGAFYKNVFVASIDNDLIKFRSDVPYEKFLTKRYDKIWGLDPENVRVYTRGAFWSVLKAKIETQTGFRYV